MYEKTLVVGLENRLAVGEKNVESAVSFLASENVPLLVAHVGEFGYRKIMFNTATGAVWVKFCQTTVRRKSSRVNETDLDVNENWSNH